MEGLLPGELERPALHATRSRRAEQVVDAARQLLEEEGPGSLTMRRLGEALGMRAPSLYKHFSGKSDVELALIEEAMADIGDASHRALRQSGADGVLVHLLATYRRYALDHPNLYRLATGGPFARERIAPGLEEWAGNPWYVVTGDPSLAQALWSFAHGMVILELDNRYPPGSDLGDTWAAGAAAFEAVARASSRRRPNDRAPGSSDRTT